MPSSPTLKYGNAPARIADAVERERERGGRVERVDPKDLARLELQRVVDDEVGESGDARVGHVCLIPD